MYQEWWTARNEILSMNVITSYDEDICLDQIYSLRKCESNLKAMFDRKGGKRSDILDSVSLGKKRSWGNSRIHIQVSCYLSLLWVIHNHITCVISLDQTLPILYDKCSHQQEHIFILKWATQKRAVGLPPLPNKCSHQPPTNVHINHQQMFTITTNKCSQ